MAEQVSEQRRREAVERQRAAIVKRYTGAGQSHREAESKAIAEMERAARRMDENLNKRG
ncbi:MAG: hypothetical protein ACTSX8_10875 [Alphaproteobacteria bacterium]